MQGSILRGVGALDCSCGCLDLSCGVLGRDEFGLDLAEFDAQADLAVEEAFSDPSGHVQYRLSLLLDQSVWPTNLSMESAPVINVTGQQEIGHFMNEVKTRV